MPAGPLPKPNPGKRHAERAAEILYRQLWDAACDEKWKVQAALDRLHTEGTADWDNPAFVAALTVRSRADERLAALACWDINDKLELLVEGGVPGDGS